MHLPRWLSRNVISLAVVSMLTDFGQEMITALLPALVISLGYSAAMLGLIEGSAQAAVSFMQVFSGWLSDRWQRRKLLTQLGYSCNVLGCALLIGVQSMWSILIARVIARTGKGLREPARDALLVDVTEPRYYARMFGFHRMFDTLGAIAGPLLVVILLPIMSFRPIFVVALIPLILAVIVITVAVQEPTQSKPHVHQRFNQSIMRLPAAYWRIVLALGVFSLGQVAVSLFLMRSMQLLNGSAGNLRLASTTTSIVFYILYNITYAALSVPLGILADNIGKKIVLSAGFAVIGLVTLGFAFDFTGLVPLALLFIGAGVGSAAVDAIARSIVADYVPKEIRATGYGIIYTIQGICLFISSVVTGLLWSRVGAGIGFGYSALMCLAGALLLVSIPLKQHARDQ